MPMSATTVGSPARRLSTRRGSISASDPYGKNAQLNMDPNRSTSSTLTIVRVLPPPTLPTTLPPDPALSAAHTQRRAHRRIGSNPSASAPPSPSQESPRLSFAFTSFTPSPPSSPRLRPASPHRPTSFSALNKPRLGPDQLLDLARQATQPRRAPEAPTSSSPLSRIEPALPAQVAPATFTPLPDDILLPFIDRPAEVHALIASPPSAKLFSLLAQTFSQQHQQQQSGGSARPRDPAQWTYAHLVEWLTRTDRDIAPDALWALKARKCILARSELIWERVKGALGVPPELDYAYPAELDDEPEIETMDGDSSSVDTEDISDDEGRAARGHWDDWDAVMDSPLVATKSRRGTMDEAAFKALVEEPLGMGGALPGGEENVGSLSIEPLLEQSVGAQATGTVESGAGLGDIDEGAEEEDDATTADATPPGEDKDHDPDLINPAQIRGLRISTTRLPYSTPGLPSSGSSPVLGPVSPLAPYPAYPAPGGSDSRRSSFASTGSFSRTRPPSFSLLPTHKDRRSGSFASTFSEDAAGGDGGAPNPTRRVSFGEGGYNPVGDRVPGNPLFPSSFARLALGPTLIANNPALRSAPHPPAPRFAPGQLYGGGARKVHTFSHGRAGHGRMGSDYAVSVGEDSSVGATGAE
ncbi:hypothetical protein BD779DRAFT_1670471 [Infundibulicybe gibba]|nr:hypothetical protein BD779DRAFT_1670471 [Infundibulicybe gibba]